LFDLSKMSLQTIIPLLRATELRPSAVWLVFVDRSGSTYSYVEQIRKIFQMISRTASEVINFSFSSDIMQGREVQMAITNLALVFRKASELILAGEKIQPGQPLVFVFATDGCHNSGESLKSLYTLMAEMFMNARNRNIPVHLIIVAYGDYPVTWISIITSLSRLYGVTNRVDIIFKSSPTTVFNPEAGAQIQDTHWNGQNPVGSYIINGLAAQIDCHIGWTSLGLAHLKAQNLSDEVNGLIAEFESRIHAVFKSQEVPLASLEEGIQINIMSLTKQDALQIPADELKRAIAAMTASPPQLKLFSSNGFDALLRYYIDKIAESNYYSPSFMETMAIDEQKKLISQGFVQLVEFPLFLVDMIAKNPDCFKLIQLLINSATSKPALYNAICGFLTLITTAHPDAITKNYVGAKRIVIDAKQKPKIIFENFITAICDAISNTTKFLLVMTPELTTPRIIQSPEFYAFLAEILSQTGDTKTHWNVTEENHGSWWQPRIVKTISRKCILDLIIRQFTSMAKPFSLSCEETMRMFMNMFVMQEKDGYGSLLTQVKDISAALIGLQSNLIKDLDLPPGQDQAVQVSQYLMYGFGFQCEILLMQHRMESTGTASQPYVRNVLKSFRQLMEKILIGCTTSEEVNLADPSVLMDETSIGYFYLALMYSYFHDAFINELWFPELRKYKKGPRLDESCINDPEFRKRVIQLLIDNGKINLHDKGAGVSHSFMMTQLIKIKVEEKTDKDVRYNEQIAIQNPIIKECILKAFKIPLWINQSISGLFQVLGSQYSDLLSPLEAIQRAMMNAQTFVLHRIGDDLPNETTIGAAIHMKFMRLEEDLITSVRLKDCMLKHAARPVPYWQRPFQLKEICMHPGCCVQRLDTRGHSDHEWAMLNGGREPRKLPMHLLSKLIDLTNRNNPRLYPILAQIQLMLKMNPGKYQSFEAMFGPTDSHLLYEWWKFAEESATMKLDFLVEYCSSQDKIVFLVKLSETKAIYVRVSLDTLTITEVYNVTDNRFSDNVMQSNITNIRYIQKFIRCIFDFERTFRVSRESVRIFHEISQVFMWNQILHMHQRVQTPMIFKYLKSLTISQRFKVRYALFGLKFMLVDRLVPTGRKRDPTQSNRKLHKMLHIYAAPRQ
jgi:hypothetical protein